MHIICSSIVGDFCMCFGIGIPCFIKLVMVLGLQMVHTSLSSHFYVGISYGISGHQKKDWNVSPSPESTEWISVLHNIANVFSSWWHAYLSMIAFKILEQYDRLPGGVSTLTNCVCQNSTRGIHTPTHNWSFSLCWLCSKSCVFYEEIGGYLEVVWVKFIMLLLVTVAPLNKYVHTPSTKTISWLLDPNFNPRKKGKKSCMSKKLLFYLESIYGLLSVYPLICFRVQLINHQDLI
jgi:hypothetical protein